jgi:hypothetical protein
MDEKKDNVIVVSVEQIGTSFLGGRLVFLSDSFANKLISRWSLQRLPSEGVATEYECPICHKGRIRAIRLTPNYSVGCRPVPSTMHHVGDKIECDCTNPECKAKFSGSHTFMWID